jgi:gliding motility-associated-like protein
MRIFLPFILGLFCFNLQGQTNTSCANMTPICTSTGINYPAATLGNTANFTNPGNNYGCLTNTPNPAWYYLEILQPGNINMTLSANNDIDFIIWGPFPNINNAISNCNSYSASQIVDCSYSLASTEFPTISNASACEVYVMLITNFSGLSQSISLVQSSGNGSTNCSILNPCSMNNISLNVSLHDSTSCNIDINGVLDFNYPPLCGTLVIKNSCSGDSVVFNPPFSSPLNFSITNQFYAPNLNCYLTAYFTYGNACSIISQIPSPLNLSVTNDTIICIGGTATVSATANGGIPPYSYNWVNLGGNGTHNVNPQSSNYYKVNVTDSLGCVSINDSVLVALHPPILVTSQDEFICPADSINLGVATIGGNGGPYNYLWTDGSGSTLGTQTSSSVVPINDSSYYYVTVNDNCETPDNNDSVLVRWYNIPKVLFDSDTTAGCYPLEVYFYNNTDISQVMSCDWNMGNGFSSNNIDTVVTEFTNPGSYHITLEVTNTNGCKNDTTFFNYIDIYDHPEAGFISYPNPASILTPTVQLQDTSSADVVYFDWTFYDSTNTIIGSDYVQNPIYSFSGLIEQQYYIQLYVENQNGCSDTVFGTQIVEDEYAFFLPNSFTPNGDGLNDSFFPVGDKVSTENYSFKIFNRWGELIFSTNDFNEKWDGTYQNNPLSSDAYIWKIDLVDSSSGEEKSMKGYVLLSK